MTDLIRREDAIKAIKRICGWDGETPEMIWSTDAIVAIKAIPLFAMVVDGTSGVGIVFNKNKARGGKHNGD